MTKRPHSDSNRRLSKLCRWILVLGALKVSLLLSLAMLPQEIFPPLFTFGNATDLTPPAHAAGELEQSVAPPAPRVRSGAPSPFAQMPAAQPEIMRPDEAVPGDGPAPRVVPFMPRDTAQRKQEELNRREQELLALQQQMQSRLDELHALEGKIQSMLKKANDVQDEKLKHLIDVYSNMKPRQAAQVLETLDERIAVRILAGMRGKQAGEVLTYMQAEPAAKLSELLSRTELGG